MEMQIVTIEELDQVIGGESSLAPQLINIGLAAYSIYNAYTDYIDQKTAQYNQQIQQQQQNMNPGGQIQ